jgi:hypothetical protein
MTGKIPWTRVFAEGVVIVGSILIAFWIDASWDQSQERSQSESLLQSLLEDFAAAEALLDTAESEHRRLVENGRRLISYGEVGAVPRSARLSVDSLLGSHFLRPVYEPPMGTVESVMSTGRFDLFDNDALLSALTDWTAAVASLQRTEGDARQHFYDRIYPYLAARIDIEDLDKGFAEHLGRPLPFEQIETDAYLLLADRELQNMLYTHWVLGTNALESEIPRVRAALDEIRLQANAEVSRE